MSQPTAFEKGTTRRRSILVGTGVVGAVGFLVLLFLPQVTRQIFRRPALNAQACFHYVAGLRQGAEVRIAGVDVGRVRRITVVPQDASCPVRIQMRLQTDYELTVPSDSVATIQQAGILGPSYVEIDISRAAGHPLADWGTLSAREPEKFDANHALDVIDAWAIQAAKDLKSQKSEPSSSRGR